MAIEYYRSCRAKVSWAFGASDTEKSQTIYLDGLCHHMHVRVPNFANSVTATVQMADGDSGL